MHYDIQYNQVYGAKGLREIKAFLTKHGIKAHYTYATKCPKQGRDFKIKPAFVKTCSSNYLSQEIERLKPKHIIVLGSNAMLGVLGKTRKITDISGNQQWDERLQVYFYPTVHQAQALYNEEQKETLFRDLARFVTWIKGESKESVQFDPPVRIVDSLAGMKKLQAMIQKFGNIATCDIETNILDQYSKSFRVRSIQFCFDPNYGGVFIPLELEEDCYYEEEFVDENGKKQVKRTRAVFWENKEEYFEVIKILRQILKRTKLIWHNGKFDRIGLFMWGYRRFKKPFVCPHILIDTMHVAHLINENRRLGLKPLTTSELGYPSYDITDKATKNLTLLIDYAARDVVACFLIAKKYIDIFNRPDMAKIKALYLNVVRKADQVFTDIELRGWPVDRRECIRSKRTLTREIRRLETEMLYILEEKGITDFRASDFGSTQKMSVLLFQRIGLPHSSDKTIAFTETGGLSTNENALIHLKGNAFVDMLLEWRGAMKALSTYVNPMLKASKTRGKITTSYKLTGTVTGRTASGKETEGRAKSTASGMNLQNIPYTFNIKNCVKAPPGWVLLNIDFSQIELRGAAEESGDKMLTYAYQNNIDVHTLRAMRVLGLDDEMWEKLSPQEQKKARGNAKPVNFGFLYGMAAPSFRQYALVQYGVEFTMREATDLRSGYFKDHSGLLGWYKKKEEEAKKYGYVESITGRRRHLPNIKLNPELGNEARRKYRDAVRQAINSPVQCLASDLKLMSMVEIDEMIPIEHGFLIGEVHDSIMMLAKEGYAMDVARKAVEIMENPQTLKKLGITLTVPIVAEAEMGPSYGELKAIDVKKAS